MFFQKRWLAVLATVMIGASTAVAVGAFTQAASAQQPAGTSTDNSAAPAAAPPAAGLPPDHEVVENPYGIDAMWKGGDFVTKGTLIVLIIMSFGSWYIILTKFFEQFRLMGQAGAARKTFWNAGNVKAGIETLKPSSPFRYIAETGVSSTQKHEGNLTEHIDLNTWIDLSVRRAIENVQNRLQDGLAFLATVGSTAPFVGLFGTVWGIYHALTAIGIAGQASIDKVAGPVGEALIMTAFGLFVAVPAVLGYNFLVRRNKVAMETVRGFGSDLHLVLLGDTGKGGR
jgi:biopolymer transport protein ExbB